MAKQYPQSPVFYDPKHRRWRYFSWIFIIGVVVGGIFLGVSLVNIADHPQLPELQLPKPSFNYKNAKTQSLPSNIPLTYSQASPLRIGTSGSGEGQPLSPKVIGFYVNWDDTSFTSLQINIRHLDVLMPEWLHLQDGAGNVGVDNQLKQEGVVAYVHENRPSLSIVPLVNNFNVREGKWDADALAGMVSDPNARSRTIEFLKQYVTENHFSGISIDFENLPDASYPHLVAFMSELYSTFHPLGLQVFQNIPLENPVFNTITLSRYTDHIILMAYDENALNSASAGPIASQQWYIQMVRNRLQGVAPEKYIIALGNYGYDWKENETKGKEVTYQEALRIASESGGDIRIHPQTLNPTFDYYDEHQTLRHVWFLDAVTAFNQVAAAKEYAPYGYALWRLGSEDPGVWKVFQYKNRLDVSVAGLLKELRYGYDIDYEGQGELLRVTGTPSEGSRDISFDNHLGFITQEHITKYPSAYTITRWGKDDIKKIALTFDDGPDRIFTPQILDVLKEYHAPATFFIIGMHANLYPAILQREFDEGHEIGNHTYTHPNITALSEKEFGFELNAVNKLLSGFLGHYTVLFRPPYAEDIEPATPSQVQPLVETSSLGYYNVGMRIDPKDWEDLDAATIADRVVAQAEKGDGNIVLLHDGGGNRAKTVEALPEIITRLREKDFQLVLLSGLVGVSRDDVMPEASKGVSWIMPITRFAFSLLYWIGSMFSLLFVVGIVLGLARFLFIGTLAIIHKIRSQSRTYPKDSVFHPKVSVIIPAYNEEKVIGRTIHAILKSDYQDVEIIVVDDGSTDDTLVCCEKLFGNHPRVRVYSKENEGKSNALNYGIALTDASIVITLDADTIFYPDTIRKLVRHFFNPRIGAVAGNVKVGNRVNVMTYWQALEYITSQNLDRRAFALMNCITVVPGSVGAWRREAVLQAGGFSSRTLAEDADLTFSIIRKGYAVEYDDQALGVTEAPESIGNFLKQRFRWMYGTLQTVWRHREIMFRPKYGALGLFASPNIVIFQVLFPFFSPLMDIVFLASVAWIIVQRHHHPLDYSAVYTFKPIILYTLIFLYTEVLVATVAFLLEPKERFLLLIWIPWQRILYRQLIYLTALKTVFMAIKGKIVEWGKFERQATVREER